jgi:hypothetical protein
LGLDRTPLKSSFSVTHQHTIQLHIELVLDMIRLCHCSRAAAMAQYDLPGYTRDVMLRIRQIYVIQMEGQSV